MELPSKLDTFLCENAVANLKRLVYPSSRMRTVYRLSTKLSFKKTRIKQNFDKDGCRASAHSLVHIKGSPVQNAEHYIEVW
jgi:hypothetical protein